MLSVSYYTRGAPFTECLFLYGRYIVKKYQWGLSDIDVYHVSVYLSRPRHRCSFIQQQTCLKCVYLTGSILLHLNHRCKTKKQLSIWTMRLLKSRYRCSFFFKLFRSIKQVSEFKIVTLHEVKCRLTRQKKYFGFLLKIRHN